MSFFGDDQQERKTRGSASFGTSQLGLSSATNPDGSTYFTRGSGGELLSRRTPQGRQYYLTDSLGSVVGMTRQDGSVSNRYRYDPFGNTMNQGTAEPDPQPFKFGGEFYDSEIRLYKQGLRFYDPELGRWTQRDPLDQVTEPRQANRYGFAGQDPVNLVDPSGMWFGEDVVNDVTDWTNENLGLSGNELGGLAVDSTLGVVACWRGGPAGCGVGLGGATVGGGLYDATDNNDDWWVKEASE